MSKSKSSMRPSEIAYNPEIQNMNDAKRKSSNKARSQELADEISSLSYEESLKALDKILENLQNDSVAVEDLHKYYLRGKLYLEHCEELLGNVEQEVIELNLEDLN